MADLDTTALEELVTALWEAFITVIIGFLSEFFWTLFDVTWIKDSMPYLIVLSILGGAYIVSQRMKGDVP